MSVKIIALWAALATVHVAAQTTAELAGTVTDESGAAARHASVTAEHETTGAKRTSITDEQGRYYLMHLPPGPYRLVAELPGFQTEVRRGVFLDIGREAVIDLTLKVGIVNTTAVVTADVSPVETRATSVSAVMDERSIHELPLNGRDFAQLALLAPGVAPARRSADSGGPGTKLVIGGARPSQVSFLLDGSDINDSNNNTPGSVAGVLLGVDTLQEFRVYSNSYEASLGRSAGGIVSAVTRAGANDFHGSLFSFHRNSALDAKNFFDLASEEIPPFKRNQFGAVGEGPIVKNRTFFLASYEGLQQRLGVTNRSFVPTAGAREGSIPGRAPLRVEPRVLPYLALIPLPNERDFGDGTGEYVTSSSQATGENFVTGRLDHRFSDATSVFGRYVGDSGSVRVPDGLSLVRADTVSRNQYSTLQWMQVLSQHALNNARISFNRSRNGSANTFLRDVDPALSFLPGVPLGQIAVTGLFSVGPGRFGPSSSVMDLYQWGDDLSYTRGRHSVKLGADYRRILFQTNRPQSPYGYYQFNSLSDFLLARPRAVELTLPASRLERNWRQSMTAAYVQDDLQLSRRLVLNLGLRYELVGLPRETAGLIANLRDPQRDASTTVGGPLFINPSELNFAPRFGVAWDPFGKGITSVRAGFGLFYDPLWTDFYGNAGNRQPPYYTLGSIRNPVFPNAYSLIGSPDFVLGRIDALQFRPQSPYTMQYHLTIQREIRPDTALTLSYTGMRGVHLPRLIDANQALPQILPDGRKFFPADSVERNPNFTGVRFKVTDVNSFYHALRVGVERRFRSGLGLGVNYAWSKNIDDGSVTITQGGDNDLTQDPDNRKAERGLSNYDLRHYFVTHFVYELPCLPGPKWLARGWQWNGIATMSSGNPFSVVVGYDRARARFQAGTAPQRPDLVAGRSNNPILGGPDRYFDSAAFALPDAGFYGNLGRNTLIGPGLVNFDLSASKRFRLSEALHVQFRSELFNSLNHPNFAIPGQRTVFSGAGPVGSAGRITSTSTPSRQVQFGLKLIF